MEKKHYIAPTLTVVTFKPERGYAGSIALLSLFQAEHDDYNTYNQENWDEEGSLFGSW